MPRPADNYTHSQFELVESDNQGETVQCKHCRNWTGSVKVLNRKKEHLMKCTQYAQWRAAGHGQDLPPQNKYQKRDSSNAWRQWDGDDADPYASLVSPFRSDDVNPGATTLARNVGKFYDEIWDETSAVQSVRVRCRACGVVRVKNLTTMIDHITGCAPFLNSPEGQEARSNGDLDALSVVQLEALNIPNTGTYAGRAPHLGSRVNTGLPSHPRLSQGGTPARAPMMPPPPPPKASPSLANHLLNKWPDKLTAATQHQFLSHAGCGTLSASALSHWLGQNSHLTRAMVSFVGSLIAKVRLPETSDSRQNTLYRIMDLLISAVANIRKELTFLEETKLKYNLESDGEPITPISKAYVDLLGSVSDPRASLLEGLVVLWATEHFYRLSWQYASHFTHTMPSSNYSIPSYLTAHRNPWNPTNSASSSTSSSFYTPTAGAAAAAAAAAAAETPISSHEAQIQALRDAIIPNWSARDFGKFVDACRAVVDELANAQTTGSGREELSRCEMQFSQALFLWEKVWPEVDGMGQTNGIGDESVQEEAVTRTSGSTAASSAAQATRGVNGAGTGHLSSATTAAGEGLAVGAGKGAAIEIHGDESEGERSGEEEDLSGEEDAPMEEALDSPYGGTGLGAIAAANRVA